MLHRMPRKTRSLLRLSALGTLVAARLRPCEFDGHWFLTSDTRNMYIVHAVEHADLLLTRVQ